MATLAPDLAAVLDLIANSVTVLDESGRVVYVNAVAAQHLGFATPEEMVGLDLSRFAARYPMYDEHGAPFPWDRLPGRLVLAGHEAPDDVLIRYHEADTGKDRWAIIHAAPLAAADGTRLAVNVVNDVTERIRAEMAVRERESRLQAILAALPDLMFVQAHDGTYLEFHADDDRRLFVPPPSFLGKRPADVLTPDVAEPVMTALEHTALTGELTALEYALPLAGEERHFEARIVRLDDSRLLSIVRDLTDRVNAEAALEDLRRFEERVAAASPAILYVYDWVDQRTVYANQAVTRLLGYSSEATEVTAEPPFTALLHPEDQARLPELASELTSAADGEIVEQAFRIRHANGQWCWLASRLTVLTRAPDGRPHLVVGAALDVTAQREAADALRQSEARYRAVVENQTELVARYLPDDTTLTFVNDAYCRFYGRTRDELIGLPFLELDPPWTRESTFAHVTSIGRSSEPVIVEHEEFLPDGSLGSVQWVNRAIRDINGNLVEMQAVGRDVTELRRAETALRASETRYRAVVESQTELVARYLPDLTLTFVNDAYCRFFGRTRDELIGSCFLELIPPSTHEDVRRHNELAVSSLLPVTYEHEMFLVDGSIGYMQWIDRAIRDANGVVIELQSVGRDITELRRVEEALREREAQLRLALENAAMGTWDWKVDSEWIAWSEGSGPLCGLPAGTPGVTQEDFYGRVHPDDRERVRVEIEQRVADAADLQVEFRVFRPDGTIRWLERKGKAIARDANGRAARFLGVTVDVTARRHSEATLRSLSHQLLTLQDDERRRLARELHDGVAQDVFAITIDLASIEKDGGHLSEESRGLLAEAQSLAEHVLRVLRTHAYLLHPPILDMAGLAPALREYAIGLARRSEFEVDASAVEDVGRLASEVETALFRVAQEALTNVVRHAGTDRATLTLRSEGNMVELRVADQGKGRVADEPSPGALSIGVGIPGMRERLRKIGGRLEIASGPGWTVITARTPVEPRPC
ncbi:MAG: PAS domain S-box protein [Thermomicrobiales bacterium]